jgi:molybdopterin molybdotransferase
MDPGAAARLILQHIKPLPTERVPLREALGRVLAEDAVAPIDIPAWDNSAMDGYAVRAADVRTGAKLRVTESVPAGKFAARAVGAGEAIRIFTGAPIPKGADTVVRQEDTEPGEDGWVTLTNDRDAGKNWRRRGEDLTKGAVALMSGTALGPAQLGVLASIVHAEPLVHRTPRVAFLGSGDEIAELDARDQILRGDKVASSNSYTMDAAILASGAVPMNLGIAADTKESLRQHVSRSRGADLLVTTAGVSVGEHDYVREVFAELGGDLKAWRLRMRPGAPVGFGLLGDLPWIGLPGNPVSAMVTFELFVRPAIRKMQGHGRPFRRAVPVTVGEPITLGPKLIHFLRAKVGDEDGRLMARLTGPQGSGILTSMASADALLIVPADRPRIEAGERLPAILLDDPVHVSEPPF